MIKKRFGVVGVIAAAALAVSVMAVPTAFAAKKSIIIWADDTRGPALEKIVKQMEAEVPGYKVEVKSFASYDALGTAWDKATAATGPDIILRDGSLAISGSKSGKIQSLIVSSTTRAAFSKAAFGALTVKGRVYGIPTDADVTGMIYNTALMAKAPKTIQEIYDYYTTNKASKGLKGAMAGAFGTSAQQAKQAVNQRQNLSKQAVGAYKKKTQKLQQDLRNVQ